MTKWMNQDRWTAVTCLIIAVLFTLAIPSQTSDRPMPGARGFDLLDGAFFPELAVALFAFASVWLFFHARPRRIEPAGQGEVATTGGAEAAPGTGPASVPILVHDEVEPPGMTIRDLLWALALSGSVLVYVQLLQPLGYLAATILGVLLLAYVCGQRSLLGFFLGGVVFPVVIFYLFTRVFMVPLPRGEFWSGW
jgi:hypothetical protein